MKVLLHNLIYKVALKVFMVGFLLSVGIPVFAKAPLLNEKDISTPPPRIIRTCCSFGVDLKFAVIPLIKRTDIISRDELGTHHYLGGKNEGNGIIYTQRGGFIDIGHLRDCADWTAYLYSLIQLKKGEKGEFEADLKPEGGKKVLSFHIPDGFDNLEVYQLAGKIAYDLSVWHEIATWFGVSYIPFVPERYSSFSPEDLYSNLLGVNLGIRALKSDLGYNEAMTQLLSNTLDSLKSVSNIDETYLAMEEVENIWWTNEKNLPNKKILIERYIYSDSYLLPWLVPDEKNMTVPYRLNVPDYNLTDLYELSIKLNHKFPLKSICPSCENRTITQKNFNEIICYVRQDIEELQIKTMSQVERKQKRKERRYRKPNTTS